MIQALRRWWRYIATKLGMTLDEVADPKIQLEQAIAESRDQHRRLTDGAAAVIANQYQLQLKLDNAIEDYEKATASAKQALVLTDRATASGDATKAAGFGQAAQAYARRIINLEREIGDTRKLLEAAAQASTEAKQAVKMNAVALQKALGERERLLSQIDQARMQEQMNAAMAQLHATVGDEVPTLEEVRTKVERRLATAKATSDLSGATVDTQMLEVEEAQTQAETEARLLELREQLHLDRGAKADITVSTPQRAALEAGDTRS